MAVNWLSLVEDEVALSRSLPSRITVPDPDRYDEAGYLALISSTYCAAAQRVRTASNVPDKHRAAYWVEAVARDLEDMGRASDSVGFDRLHRLAQYHALRLRDSLERPDPPPLRLRWRTQALPAAHRMWSRHRRRLGRPVTALLIAALVAAAVSMSAADPPPVLDPTWATG